MNSGSLGQFGTWVPYISHHVIDKEEDLYEEQKKLERKIPTIMTNFLASFMFINLFCKKKRENVCELQDAEMIGIKQNDLPVNFSLENMVHGYPLYTTPCNCQASEKMRSDWHRCCWCG